MAITHGTCSRYFDVFDRESIKIIFTHELGADTEGSVRDLYRFLGVDDSTSRSTRARFNEAAGAKSRRRAMKWARGIGLDPPGAQSCSDEFKQVLKRRMATSRRPSQDAGRRACQTDGPLSTGQIVIWRRCSASTCLAGRRLDSTVPTICFPSAVSCGTISARRKEVIPA